ncbi:MAG: Zn-dependent alcohol dehydrogenase [Deltaproteobacteria bacterium]|nr:Zn-dependent alcohol dehydrogenase [Deltaproteobacteria bacterium]
MKAAVCRELGKPLTIEDIDIDPPAENEVKVRVAATAICHSDIHTIRGEIIFDPLPIVAGHESAGYVEEVGRRVTSLKPGDPVVVSLIKSCGECLNCRRGLPHLCLAKSDPEKISPLHNRAGERFSRMADYAGFAEYILADRNQVVLLPGDMPLDRAALLSCGVTTGFGAVLNRAQVRPLSSVVVIGAGGVGLNALQGAAFVGAFPVIAVDVSEKKLEAARIFGATHTINAKQKDANRIVHDLTNGRGADYVFVSVGNIKAMEQGFQMSGPRGMTVLLGLPPLENSNISISVFDLVMQSERMITGGFMGAINLQVDIPQLVALYQAGRLKLDELISGRFPLEKINEAIEDVEKGEALRNVIVF